MTDLQYPVGRFSYSGSLSAEDRARSIAALRELPSRLRAAVEGLSENQLDTPYRPGGWTVRQVVHHVADSHMNSFVRFRLALTEDNPTVKPYDEKLWAELEDSRAEEAEVSLVLIDALHRRWVRMLESLTDAEWSRTYLHPDDGLVTVEKALAIYDWHGRHHTAHVVSLRERMGWR